MVDPGVNDDLVFAGEAEEEAIALVELGAEPMLVIAAKSVSLAELRGVGVGGNEFASVSVDNRKQLCRRKILIPGGVGFFCSHLFGEAGKLLGEKRKVDHLMENP